MYEFNAWDYSLLSSLSHIIIGKVRVWQHQPLIWILGYAGCVDWFDDSWQIGSRALLINMRSPCCYCWMCVTFQHALEWYWLNCNWTFGCVIRLDCLLAQERYKSLICTPPHRLYNVFWSVKRREYSSYTLVHGLNGLGDSSQPLARGVAEKFSFLKDLLVI